METSEPIAIIGMAGRFANGVDSLEKFWNLLRQGADVIGELPSGRWDWYAAQSREHAAVLQNVTKRGAFLEDLEGFDAEFFDITPREAAIMDPQQRIILELSWEALEHAGIAPGRLAGTDTGVFMGVGADDYGRRGLEDLPRIEAWTGIGGAYCGVANRVSYVLDFRGPSVAVDTACSSSLVAIHLAVQALRAGECPVALAGGVLVIAAPGLSLVLDAAGATAGDGRCKSFDARADGYGRGEGGGVVVLKRLADAVRDGDRVLAVIRGSAVHQDGRTSGIMAPNGEAQAHLMRRTYQAAGVDPGGVGYVEAHGTGTRAGDPLEAEAMSAIFGAGRASDRPCLIGSVKPNIGHLEAGAGVAGVIKTVLALQHGEIPPSLNVTKPNPAVDWERSGLRVVTELTPWPDHAGPRRAGVSGYGYGGTIAHVILEEAEDVPERGGEDSGPAVYPISAASRAALTGNARRLADYLESTGAAVGTVDVGHTLAHRRSHLAHRAAVYAANREQLAARLREFAESETAAASGTPLPGGENRVVWVFSGHGSQWVGMGRELLAADPAFAGVIDRIDPVFTEELGVSARAALLAEARQPVHVAQPLIFAVQSALAEVWRACGVRPAAVIGHSVGEIAAAVTAGVFTLEQGARLVCRRSALLRQVAGKGAMAMVNLPPDEAARRLHGRDDAVAAVAASTGSTVISGDVSAVAEVTARWEAEGLAVRRVDSDVAFHSPHMEPLVDALAAAVADLKPEEPAIPLYSTALTDPRSAAPRDGAYWAANLRGQVRFAQAVAAAVEDGYRLFLEVAPHPVVAHSINEMLEAHGIARACVAHSLRRAMPEKEELLTNLGLLYCHGAELGWLALWPQGRLASLPTMAWQHKPHWFEQPPARRDATEQHDPQSHTLLGGRISVHGATPARVWLTYLDRRSRPYPGDHPVRAVEIIPAAVLLNTFLAAATATGPWSDLADVALRVPVSLTYPRDLQVVLQDSSVRLSSRVAADGQGDIAEGADDEKGWLTHTTAVIEPGRTELTLGAPDVVANEELPGEYVVDRLASLGVAGMGFPWQVERLRAGDGTLVATVRAGETPGDAPVTWAPVLDAALSIASVAFGGPSVLRMPAHIHRVSLAPEPPARFRVTVRVIGDHTVDVWISRSDGTVLGVLSRLRYGTLHSDTSVVGNPQHLVHEIVWRPAHHGELADPSPLILVGADTAVLGMLTERCAAAGMPYRVVAEPEDLRDNELAAGRTVLVVPHLGPVGETAEVTARAAWLLARSAQRLAAAGSATVSRLWCVTQGVRESADERALSHAALWGLGRIIGGEYPEFWGGVVDIGESPSDVPALIDLLGTVRGEDVVVVRDGEATVPRLQRLRGEPVRPPVTCEPDGSYLITGGLGVLGLATAHHLADRGARRIILAGRNALPPRDAWDQVTDHATRSKIDLIRSLERRGITVITAAVDIAEPEATGKLLSPSALGLPPIRGVVHAAGVLDNRMLRDLDEESLRSVLRPKVDGALVLHQLFPPGSLDFFVMFSSCGQLLGLPGQASYAAGNAFLDALAAHRRSTGDPTTSYGWTSWRGLGMSTSSAVIDAELAARGTADISLAEAFGSWELTERYDLGYAAVLRVLPPQGGERPVPLLSEATVAEADGTGETEPETVPWRDLDGDELHTFLVEQIRRDVAAQTRLPVAELDPHRPLLEMGLDSVMTVYIRRVLERRFRLPLPATLFWDQPTIHAVATLLAERLRDQR